MFMEIHLYSNLTLFVDIKVKPVQGFYIVVTVHDIVEIIIVLIFMVIKYEIKRIN